VQHAGICLGAGPLSEALVNQFKVWSENTRDRRVEGYRCRLRLVPSAGWQSLSA